MYSSYDYEVKRWVSANGLTSISLRDPNIGILETFQDEGSGTFIPVSAFDYHTKILQVTPTHITFRKLDGRRLGFEWTGYVQNGVSTRARLQYIEDRNGNRVTLDYPHPATTTTQDVLNRSTVTDSYGRTLRFRYLLWRSQNVVDQVILPDGRSVTYRYDASPDPAFASVASEIDYGTDILSTLRLLDHRTFERNEALLEADHYRQIIETSAFARGRTRSVKRADGTFLYSRMDHAQDDVITSTQYNRGETFEIKASASRMLISHRQQRVDGSWEEETVYRAPRERPVTGILQPDERSWKTERDDGNDRVTQRTYPDGATETFTFNDFAQMTSHIHRSGAIETWRYDARGNLLSHTEAAGVRGVRATERWTYNARGQVVSHRDFNCNSGSVCGITTYQYYPSGDLRAVTLPASDGQPPGRITYSYDAAGRLETVTDPVGRAVTYDYDSAGRLTEVSYPDGSTELKNYGTGELSARVLSSKDRNGNLTIYTYDATGRVLTTQVQDAGTDRTLQTVTNTWDAETGRLMSVQRDGDATEYTYDYKGRVLTTTVHPTARRSLTTTNVYDQYHLIEAIDPYGRKTRYTYDDLDRLLCTTAELTAGGGTITTCNEYDAEGRRTAYVDGRGIRYEYRYDARDRLRVERSAVGTPVQATDRYFYDANNNVLRREDKNGGTWPKTYTARNAVRSDADPLGGTYTYTYWPDGLRKTETNPNAHTTEYVYDECCGGTEGGRLVEIIDADRNSITYAYDFNGNRTRLIDQSGHTTAFTFDGLNRLTERVVDPEGLRLRTELEYLETPLEIGRKEIVTSPAGQRVTNRYDGIGRIASITGDIPSQAVTYDVMQTGAPCLNGGFLAETLTDGNGNSRTTLADAARRTVAITDGRGNTTCMTYDDSNNMRTVRDRDGRQTSYDYDERNRRTRLTADEIGIAATTAYEYDAVGSLVKSTDPEGISTAYQYDDAYRRQLATYAFGRPDRRSWAYTYSPLGQLKAVAKPNGVTIDDAYDHLERLARRTYSRNGTPIGTDTFTYHANGLLRKAVGGLYGSSVDRSVLAADYDGAGRVLRERQNIGSGPKPIAYSYYADDVVNEITYPSGRVVAHAYTNRRELREVKIDGVVQASQSYDLGGRPQSRTYANGRATNWTHDASDRIVSVSHESIQAWRYRYTPEGDSLLQVDATTPMRSESYGPYDGLHRLRTYSRGHVVGNGIPLPLFQQQWTLDKVGNWSEWNDNGDVETRAHDGNHALTARSRCGGPLRYDLNGNQIDDGCRYTYVYDAADQLREVRNRSTNELIARYRYDALGRRIQKSLADGARLRYYYSGERIIEERTGADAVAATFTYGVYTDEPLTMETAVNRYYYHSNSHFSVYALSDITGSVVERYSYTPYGETTSFDAEYQAPLPYSRVGNPFSYTGRELDSETRLLHYRLRTQDPIQGRFKQRDPLEYVDGMNLYEYGRSRPLDALDPTGSDDLESFARWLAEFFGLNDLGRKVLIDAAKRGASKKLLERAARTLAADTLFTGAVAPAGATGTYLGVGTIGGGLVVAGAAAVGFGLGSLIGWGISEIEEARWDSTLPPPTVPCGGCRSNDRAQHVLTAGGLTCPGAYGNARNAAEASCSGTCTGACPGGKPCTPFADIFEQSETPGWLRCHYTLRFLCSCGCR